jgi:hypothetical protein
MKNNILIFITAALTSVVGAGTLTIIGPNDPAFNDNPFPVPYQQAPTDPYHFGLASEPEVKPISTTLAREKIFEFHPQTFCQRDKLVIQDIPVATFDSAESRAIKIDATCGHASSQVLQGYLWVLRQANLSQPPPYEISSGYGRSFLHGLTGEIHPLTVSV